MCKKGSACVDDYRCRCEDTDTGAGLSSHMYIIVIPKTIGNRKKDCA